MPVREEHLVSPSITSCLGHNELPDYLPQGGCKTYVHCKITISIFTPADKNLLIMNHRVIVMQVRHAHDTPEFDLETFNLLTHETQHS